MSNQVINQKVSGTPNLMGDKHAVVRILMALLVIALFLALASNMGKQDLSGNESSEINIVPIPNQNAASFSTEQYWDLANKSAAGVSAPVAVESSSFSTEQYWDLAKMVVPASEYQGFSTQQYWDLAKESRIEESEYAYYTERYWILSKNR
jgi:hypothetical protein